MADAMDISDVGDTVKPRAVELQHVRKTFGPVVAVADIDLVIDDGEFFSLLGPSGSGKTTVLRMIAGFERPDSGTVLLGGRDVTSLAPYDRDVNTVFQDYALFPHMTVQENVEYGLRVKGDRARRPTPAGGGHARHGPPRRVRRSAAESAVGRPASAGRAGHGRSSTTHGCCCSTNRSEPST